MQDLQASPISQRQVALLKEVQQQMQKQSELHADYVELLKTYNSLM